MSDPKTPVDVAAVTVAGFSWAEFLPAIAAVFSIVWMMLRIYETRTIQRMIKKLRSK